MGFCSLTLKNSISSVICLAISISLIPVHKSYSAQCPISCEQVEQIESFLKCSSEGPLNACTVLGAVAVIGAAGTGAGVYKVSADRLKLSKEILAKYLDENKEKLARSLAKIKVETAGGIPIDPKARISEIDDEIRKLERDIINISKNETVLIKSDKNGRLKSDYLYGDADREKIERQKAPLKKQIDKLQFEKQYIQKLVRDGRSPIYKPNFIKLDKSSQLIDFNNQLFDDLDVNTKSSLIQAETDKITSLSKNIKTSGSKALSAADKQLLNSLSSYVQRQSPQIGKLSAKAFSSLLTQSVKKGAGLALSSTGVRLLAGTVAGGLLSIATTEALACSSFDDAYTNAEAGTFSSCEPGKRFLSDRNAPFFDLSCSEQNEFLNSSRSGCKYYEDWFKDIVESQPESVTCSGGFATATFNIREQNVARKVNVRYEFSSSGLSKVIFNPDSREEIEVKTTADYKPVSETYRIAKETPTDRIGAKARSLALERLPRDSELFRTRISLNTEPIVNCCRSSSEKQRECLRQFNGKPNSNTQKGRATTK